MNVTRDGYYNISQSIIKYFIDNLSSLSIPIFINDVNERGDEDAYISLLSNEFMRSDGYWINENISIELYFKPKTVNYVDIISKIVEIGETQAIPIYNWKGNQELIGYANIKTRITGKLPKQGEYQRRIFEFTYEYHEE